MQKIKKQTIMTTELTIKDIDRIIEMAWEDRTPFEAIKFQFGLQEKEVIEFMYSGNPNILLSQKE